MVGFNSTFQSVVEGGTVQVCVRVISPPDIGDAAIYLEVLSSTNPAHYPADAPIASKLLSYNVSNHPPL